MRKVFSIVTAVLAMLSVCVVFCGCSSNTDGYGKVISEIRDEVYTANVGGHAVQGFSGEREKNYKTDGIPNGREEFFILTVEGVFASAPECEFEIEGKTYGGVMKKHPFNDSYSFEAGIKTNAKEINVSIKTANDTFQTELKTVKTDGTKTASYALDTAKSELRKTLENHIKNGTFDGEVYVRLIANPVEEDGKYFWYVAFCVSESECYSVLIDSESGDVVATKGK